MIFADYLSGMGKTAIAKKLNRLEIPTMHGGPWKEGSVYRIITNEKYTGNLLLQKTYRLDHISKKRMINRGELPQFYVENSHAVIIDKATFEQVQREITRRAEKLPPVEWKKPDNLFTSLLICGICGKHFHRKTANSSSKYAKPAWVCPTFNSYGKSACPAQQIPERILIAKTSEVLGCTDLERETLLQQITEIQVPAHNCLIYVFRDGHTQEITWQNPSRRESWTDDMKQKARERQLEITERRHKK